MKKLTILILLLLCSSNLLKAEEFLLKNNLGTHIKILENLSSIRDFKVVDNKVIALSNFGTILRFSQDGEYTGELIDSPGFTCLGDEYNKELLVGRRDGSIYSLNVDNFELTKLGAVNLPPLFILNVENNAQREVLAITYNKAIEQPDLFNEEDSSYTRNIWINGETIVDNLTRHTQDTFKIMSWRHGNKPTKMLYSKKYKLVYYSLDAGRFGADFGYYDYINHKAVSMGEKGIVRDFLETSKGDVYGYIDFGREKLLGSIIFKIDGKNCFKVYQSINSVESKFEYYRYHEKIDSINNFKGCRDYFIAYYDSLNNISPIYSINYMDEKMETGELLVYSGKRIFSTDTTFKNWRIVDNYSIKVFETQKEIYLRSGRPTKIYTFKNGAYVKLNYFGDLAFKTIDTESVFKITNQLTCFRNSLLTSYNSGVIISSGPFVNYYKDGKIKDYYDSVVNGNLKYEYISKGYEYNHSNYFFMEENKLYDLNWINRQNDSKLLIINLDDFKLTEVSEYPTNSIEGGFQYFYFKQMLLKSFDNKLALFKKWKLMDTCKIKGFPELEGMYYPFYANYIVTDTLPNIVLFTEMNVLHNKEMRIRETAKIDIVDGKLKAELFYFVDKDTLTIYTGCAYKDKAVLFSDAGVYEYDFKDNKLKKFNIDLIDTNISECCIDKLGRIWICGDYLYRIDDIYNAKVERILNLRNEEIKSLIPNDYGKGVYFYVLGRGAYIVEE